MSRSILEIASDIQRAIGKDDIGPVIVALGLVVGKIYGAIDNQTSHLSDKIREDFNKASKPINGANVKKGVRH